MNRVLPCGCHKISDSGEIFTRLEQFSSPGLQGIQVRRNNHWKKLSGTIGKSGYVQISIHGRLVRVNRLVAMNFIPNPMAYPEAQHKNGIRTQNGVTNLKWGNQKHNAEDRDAHGNTARGVRNPNAKLTDSKVRRILVARSRGQTLQTIADRFQVSKKLVLLIVQGKIWTHITQQHNET